MELSVIILPLIASILSGFFGRYIGDRNSEIVTSLLVSVSAIISFVIISNENSAANEKNILDVQSGATFNETYNNKAPVDVLYKIKLKHLKQLMFRKITNYLNKRSKNLVIIVFFV